MTGNTCDSHRRSGIFSPLISVVLSLRGSQTRSLSEPSRAKLSSDTSSFIWTLIRAAHPSVSRAPISPTYRQETFTSIYIHSLFMLETSLLNHLDSVTLFMLQKELIYSGSDVTVLFSLFFFPHES